MTFTGLMKVRWLVIIIRETIASDLATWKIRCYVRPSLQILPNVPVFQFLKVLYERGIPIGLVHPKAKEQGEVLRPITKEGLESLLASPDHMVCQPYVVAAGLMEIQV